MFFVSIHNQPEAESGFEVSWQVETSPESGRIVGGARVTHECLDRARLRAQRGPLEAAVKSRQRGQHDDDGIAGSADALSKNNAGYGVHQPHFCHAEVNRNTYHNGWKGT